MTVCQGFLGVQPSAELGLRCNSEGRARPRGHQAGDRQHCWWYAVELDCERSAEVLEEGLKGSLLYNLCYLHGRTTGHPFRGMSVSVRLDGARRMVGHVCRISTPLLH